MPFSAVLGFLGAQEQAGATEAAANTSAAAQLESARLASEAAKFRPVGVTTRFGSSNFQMSPEGYLTSAGYNVSPELQAYQDRLSGLTGGALTQAEMAQQQFAPLSQAATGLFSLGQQYLAQSPEQVAAQYMSRQQDLLAPSRERQMAQLQNQLFQQGRGGLSVGATGARPSGAAGLGATTPELEAYYNAIAQQDAGLAAQAQQAGQQNVAFGAGLFGTGAGMLGQYQAGQVGALSPFQTYLGTSQSIEEMGQQPLTLGAGLGGQAAAYGANAGKSLLTGGMSAALTQQAAGGFSPEAGLYSAFANSPQFNAGVQNLFSGFGQPSGMTGAQNDLLAAQGGYYRQQPSASAFSFDGQQI
jgi:hypothetical protein